MKLIKTESFKIISRNPWFELGYVSEGASFNFSPADYPKIFAEVYQFESGEQVCIGDLVYRISTKSHQDVVKTVQLQEIHLKNDIEIFPSCESAEEELKRRSELLTAKYVDGQLVNLLNQINLFSSADLDSLTMTEIKRKFTIINEQSSSAIQILKSQK